eukprot:218231_1
MSSLSKISDVDRLEIETKAISCWVDHVLSRREKIYDLVAEISKGSLLVELADKLLPRPLKLSRARALTHFQRADHVTVALSALKRDGVISRVDVTDILGGDPKVITVFLWELVQRYHLPPAGSASSRKSLLMFVRKQVLGFGVGRVQNFSSAWSDGKLLMALIDSLAPGARLLEGQLSDPMSNCEKAIVAAQDFLGISAPISALDLVKRPVEEAVMIFVAFFWEKSQKNCTSDVPSSGEAGELCGDYLPEESLKNVDELHKTETSATSPPSNSSNVSEGICTIARTIFEPVGKSSLVAHRLLPKNSAVANVSDELTNVSDEPANVSDEPANMFDEPANVNILSRVRTSESTDVSSDEEEILSREILRCISTSSRPKVNSGSVHKLANFFENLAVEQTRSVDTALHFSLAVGALDSLKVGERKLMSRLMPADEKVDEPTDELINEKVDEPTDEKVDEPTDEKIDEPTGELADEKFDKHADELADESTDESAGELIDKPTDEPADEQVYEILSEEPEIVHSNELKENRSEPEEITEFDGSLTFSTSLYLWLETLWFAVILAYFSLPFGIF